MAKNSISPKVAMAVQRKVASYIKDLDYQMSALATEVETLNKSYWHGGGNANEWYNKIQQHYINGLTANDRLNTINDTLKKQVNNYKSAVDSK